MPLGTLLGPLAPPSRWPTAALATTPSAVAALAARQTHTVRPPDPSFPAPPPLPPVPPGQVYFCWFAPAAGSLHKEPLARLPASEMPITTSGLKADQDYALLLLVQGHMLTVHRLACAPPPLLSAHPLCLPVYLNARLHSGPPTLNSGLCWGLDPLRLYCPRYLCRRLTGTHY